MSEDERVNGLRVRAEQLGIELQQNDENPALWALLRRPGEGVEVFGGTLDEVEAELKRLEREKA